MRVDLYIYVHFVVFVPKCSEIVFSYRNVPKCAEINRDEPRWTEMNRDEPRWTEIRISVHLGSSRFISVHSRLSLLPRKSEIWRFLGSSRFISVHSRFILEMDREWTEMNRDEPRFFKKIGNRLVLYNLSFCIYTFDKRLVFNNFVNICLIFVNICKYLSIFNIG